MSIYLCNLFHSIQFISSVTRFPFVERLLFLTGCDCLDSRHSKIHNDGDPEKTFHTGSHRGQFVRHSVRAEEGILPARLRSKPISFFVHWWYFPPFPSAAFPTTMRCFIQTVIAPFVRIGQALWLISPGRDTVLNCWIVCSPLMAWQLVLRDPEIKRLNKVI